MPNVHCRATAALALALLIALTGCGGGSSVPADDPTSGTPGDTSGSSSGGTDGGSDPQDPPSDPVTPQPPTVRLFSAAAAPDKLSAWGAMASDGRTLTLAAGVLPYALNTPLFSDYTHKFRTLWLPPGTQIEYTASGPLRFPVGAVVTKTFFYPKATASTPDRIGALQAPQVEGGESIDLATHVVLETRLMVREPNGTWGAVTYVWDADQRDATLRRDGPTLAIELVGATGTRTPFTFAVPNDLQCVQCHATDATTMRFEAIGPTAANMNRRYAYAAGEANQLDRLATLQMLSGYAGGAPRLTAWDDTTATVTARARAYLDVNCSSCHNPAGRSGGTGLWLGADGTDPLALGICKAPVGGQRHAQFTYDVVPGDPDASFLYYRLSNYRLNADPPRVAMPESGRHVFHAEGNALIRDWIAGLSGCGI